MIHWTAMPELSNTIHSTQRLPNDKVNTYKKSFVMGEKENVISETIFACIKRLFICLFSVLFLTSDFIQWYNIK